MSKKENHWWRDHFSIRPSPGSIEEAPFIEIERAAWAYELVRRIAKRRLLPFIALPIMKRIALQLAVEHAAGYKPLVKSGPRGSSRRAAGYSSPLPPLSFDLDADESEVVSLVCEWFKEQRITFAGEKKRGPKGRATRNNVGFPKKIDWEMVELLDHERGNGKPLTETQRTKLTRARKFARGFEKVILSEFSRLAGEVRLVKAVSEQLITILPAEGNQVAQADSELILKLFFGDLLRLDRGVP